MEGLPGSARSFFFVGAGDVMWIFGEVEDVDGKFAEVGEEGVFEVGLRLEEDGGLVEGEGVVEGVVADFVGVVVHEGGELHDEFRVALEVRAGGGGGGVGLDVLQEVLFGGQQRRVVVVVVLASPSHEGEGGDLPGGIRRRDVDVGGVDLVFLGVLDDVEAEVSRGLEEELEGSREGAVDGEGRIWPDAGGVAEGAGSLAAEGRAFFEDVDPDVLGEVGADGGDELCLEFDEVADDVEAHGHSRFRAPLAVGVPRELEARGARDDAVAPAHLLEGRCGVVGNFFEFIRKGSIDEVVAVVAEVEVASFADPPRELFFHEEHRHRRVGPRAGKIRVLQGIPGLGEGQPHGVRRVEVAGLLEHQEVPRRFRHLLRIQEHKAVAVHRPRPQLGLLVPDGRVVVEAHRQVVPDQILPGDPEVHRVPVPKLPSHLIYLGRRLLRPRPVLQEDVVPGLVRHCGRRDETPFSFGSVEVVGSLKDVGNGVVCHVDRRIRQGLDDPLRIPGDLRAEAEEARAGPLAHPAEGVLELGEVLGVVGLEARVDVGLDLLSPFGFAVLEVPLVRVGDDAGIARPRNDFFFRLEVEDRFFGPEHVLLDF
mmetsp:Transcript_4295/g.14240  ORF Transcript_4295/g.14240 Transcript_4295/m.14240 type:complete len:593 (-) Transcript_4295:1642-3420(-)